ncbi:MAG: redox-regulated ATPase YchF [Patescibacteria group bacterium]|nr:redox-regulated ATPase YchF [Patescibacteria group bacterium]
MSVTRSHSLSIGIVGLPNSGKSTIFNALTKSSVPAENYPFCTIDKNIGVVKIPDQNLERLAKIMKSEKIIPSAMTFVDIAGLVKGASKGEGLGNQFLGHIRETNAIMYMLRAFKSENVAHVYDNVNPVDDLKILRSELIIKDIETVENRLDELKSKMKGGHEAEFESEVETLQKVMKCLDSEVPAILADLTEDERIFLKELWLLTDKPAFYVLNIKAGMNEPDINVWLKDLNSELHVTEQDFVISVDCRTEADLNDMGEKERKDLVQMINEYKGVDDLVETAYKRLDLVTFYTANKVDAHAWTIKRGANIKEAAGLIHTDLEQNFVSSEVINIAELMKANGWLGAKEKGLMKIESKDYYVKNGDCVIILATH